jgi:hemolysin activation/secretion protein
MMGQSFDREGIGGYRTVRGLLRNRVQGPDEGFYNIELRWRMLNFVLWKQNIGLGLNTFTDGGLVTRKADMSYKGAEDAALKAQYETYMSQAQNENLHISAGAGFRVILNENFIISLEYARPFNKQDGYESFYLNTGYLF